ncbi:hypothetical protein SETIT_7G275500v2 [Setaria italica]|uniref:Disease resistance N-terminal domain-containing protein n=1 Tax=Setaria italica TaxID=4555 RepID=A0A368S0F6_SETIT|nr:hypothetical protein SETIT_7G275500v2 [Setaria italica]
MAAAFLLLLVVPATLSVSTEPKSHYQEVPSAAVFFRSPSLCLRLTRIYPPPLVPSVRAPRALRRRNPMQVRDARRLRLRCAPPYSGGPETKGRAGTSGRRHLASRTVYGSPVPAAFALAPPHIREGEALPRRFMAASATLVFAGKSVATPAISFLINKAFTYLNKYRNAEGVAEMKDRILGRLDQIQAVFDVFNPERIKGESRALDAWLWKLRDAVEKAEDALDDVEYYELEKKAKDRKVSNWGSTFDKIKHNAMKYVTETTIVDKATKGLTHGGSLKRLRKSLEGLDKAAAGVADFVTLAECLRGSISQLEEDFLKDRETGSNLTAPEVFGQNKEKELLIGWLTKPSCEDAEIKFDEGDRTSEMLDY